MERIKTDGPGTPCIQKLSVGSNKSSRNMDSEKKWKSISSESLSSNKNLKKTRAFQWDENDVEAFKLVRQKNRLEANNDTGFVLNDNNQIASNLGLVFRKFDSNLVLGQNQDPPDKKVIDRMLKDVGQKMKQGAYSGAVVQKIKKTKKFSKRKNPQPIQSSGSIHDLLQKNSSNPNSINPIVNSDHDQKQNARAALQNERMKLNQSLMKPIYAGGQIKSSTNEGSNTFGKLHTMFLNSGSHSSSDKGESASFGLCISGNMYTDQDEHASSRSLLGNSFTSSFYEFRSQQPKQFGISKKVEKLTILSNDRRSMFNTPLVEFDTLGQNKKKNNVSAQKCLSYQRQNSLKFGSDHTSSRIGFGGQLTPVATRQQLRHNLSFIESFAEVVEEEKQEDDREVLRRTRFKMLKDKNEFNKSHKRNRSTDFLKEIDTMKPAAFNVGDAIGDVSEDEEEEISDSSLEKQKTDQNKNMKKGGGKTYSIGYLTKKIWSNKIYSDDFDVDFETLKNNQNERFKLGSVINSAIQEDVESEMENPYFSDNSSSSQLTTKLRKFSLELQKLMDKSDNESSARSVGGTGANNKTKLSHYQSTEPIQEVEDEKEEIADQKLISESIQKRRKASKHIDRDIYTQFPTKSQMLIESDPIHEEIEIEDDELLSENNFYLSWQNHKRYLLTQDEQLKINEDSRSSAGIFEKKGRKGALSGRVKRRKKKEKFLDPIEEKKDDYIEQEGSRSSEERAGKVHQQEGPQRSSQKKKIKKTGQDTTSLSPDKMNQQKQF